MANNDDIYMRRAIRLAMDGRGVTEPNPSVGCVIVKNDRVIGEGRTQYFGGPHAEPTALASCTQSPEGATAYVTLEPCCHLNKKTPPCAPRLIEAKIARVVHGCLDPNPDVNGKGLAMLRAAGIEVVGPIMEAETRQLIAPFIGRIAHRRPYVTLKWAQTADGKIAGPGGARLQISNAASSAAVHALRSRSDAILIGIGTALADDPMLTARVGDADAAPAGGGAMLAGASAAPATPAPSRLHSRIVLDSHLRLPPTSQLATSTDALPVDVYFTRDGFIEAGPAKLKALMAAGVTLREAPADLRGRIALPALIQSGRMADVTHLLIEPGPTLARSCFDAGAADRLWIIQSPMSVNDPTAPNAPAVPSRFLKTAEITLDGDVLTEYVDQESDLFFATVPSADMVLATR